MHYASVDDAVAIIQQLGQDTQLIKLDIKDTYRIVPVHPADYNLLGITWRGNTYLDRALPFGLRSAPKIFNAISNFIAWILSCNGIQHQLHYLDDFLFLTTPNSRQGQQILSIALETLRRLGVPIAVHKTEGPSSVLIFLGILILIILNFVYRPRSWVACRTPFDSGWGDVHAHGVSWSHYWYSSANSSHF